MIELTNLAQQKIWINQDLIRTMESVPDTILCFSDGTRLPICESPLEVQTKIIEFLRQLRIKE